VSPEPTNSALRIENVTKRFGETAALDGVSLAVAPGEFCVLLGPSGCGKSTLLRIIAGLEEATSGEISIGGKTVTRLEARERDVAMVFQNYALYPHLTVYDNLAFPLRVRKTDRRQIESQVREAAEMLRIGNLLPRRPRELSGGQRQRVAIGRAIVRRPKLFLFDEPLSNLDAQLRLSMRVEIARLHRRIGSTSVYVTHDQVEAMTLATRIVLMNAGRFEQVGTPGELYERPATRFVATFVGSPAMNLIEGEVKEGLFHGSGLRLEVPAPDGTATLGVRPEDLELQPGGPWEGAVDLVEDLGAEVLVHASCGEGILVARVLRGPKIRSGQKINLGPRRIHLFDGAGRRVDI
jgi:sn-glycerol 3-phosphate transport system ATP-binding protein